MNIFKEKSKFEELLLEYKICPLTVAYHGSLFIAPHEMSDLDVILIVQSVTPELIKKLHGIAKKIESHIGITLVSVREAGTIFGGIKYQDALHRNFGSEEKHPYAYYKIATLNELFRRMAIEMNQKKCINIAKIITKTINNLLNSELVLEVKDVDVLIVSLEANLKFFYDHEKIKPGSYNEQVKLKY